MLGAGEARAQAATGSTGATGAAGPERGAVLPSGAADDLATLGLRTSNEAGPAPATTPSASATGRPAARRSRPATALPVRSVVRAPTVSSRVKADVQAPVVGLPDPVPVLDAAPPRRRPSTEDPYAQLGLRSGGVTFYPSIEESVGYDTNPERTAVKQGSALLRTEGGLRVQSDWPVHELKADLRGAYNVYPDLHSADRPEGSGLVNLRLDASRDTPVDLEGRFVLDTQRPGSPDLTAAVRDRPLVANFGASAGVTQRFNRLSLGLRGNIDRGVFEDARLTNGSILDQSDRNENRYGVQLRAGYEVTPGLIPFVEALADTRVYDQKIDSSGFARDSTGFGGRIGTTFELTRLLTGEVSAGYQTRHYDDARLRDLNGPLVDAALIWSATPLTTVRLRAQSQIDETTVAFSSGVLFQRASLEVQHDLRRNLSVTAALALSEADYRGVQIQEDGIAGSVKVDYRMTRSLVVRASFTHERLKSSSPGSDYTANTYLIGLRFQP